MKKTNSTAWLPGKVANLLVLLLMTFASATFAQSTKVSGTISDQNGDPLIGVTVLVQGTASGVLSDENGRYEIETEKGATLLMTMVSFETQSIVVGDQTTINVTMKFSTLEEVVVTGYTSQRQRDITGAVSVIDTDEMNEVSATSFIQKLEGRSSGLSVSTSGEPGAGSNIRIRGIGSFLNNDPLYVIDGVPVQDNFGTGLNPADIETIQVLKDASAASIYGSRANNGVIIVTTKKGKAGKIRVNYDGYIGSQSPVGQYDLITNPADYSEVVWRSHENAGIDIPTEVPYAAGRGVIPAYLYDGNVSGYPGTGSVDESTYSYPNNLIMASNPNGTDWWNEVFDPAMITEHTLSVSGGTNNSNFYISAGYLNQQGTMIETYFERASVRANSSFTTGRFTFGESLSITRSQSVGQRGGNQSEGNIMTQILKAQSIIPVFDVSGVNYAGGKANGLSNGSNPVALLNRSRDNEGTFYRVLGSAYGEFKIIDGLKARTSLGVDQFNNFTQGFNFPTWENSEPTTINGFNENWSTGFTWTWTNTLEYSQTFGDAHDLSAYIGYEAIKGSFRNIGGSLANYFTTDINAWYLNTGLADPSSRSVGSGGSFRSLNSTFAKVDYGYDDKYLISATIRRDGSSNFGDEKYGVFPAFSLGWRVSGESFMQNVTAIEDLKVRFGWGKTGNQDIPGGNAFDRFGGGPGSSFYAINGGNSLATGYALNSRGNAGTKWEENVSTNIGIDASLFSGKLLLVLDLYQRTTNGLLFNPALPATSGTAAAPFVNIANMENRGLDFSATYNNSFGDLGVELSAIFSAYRNEIVSIDGSSESFFSTGGDTRIGRTAINVLNNPIGTFYGFTVDPVDPLFRSQAEVESHATQDGAAVGRLRFVDINEDGVINDDDKGIIGSPHPDFIGSFNIGLNYKNFDFSTFLYASVGNDIFNYNKLFEVFRFFNTNVRKEVLDRSYHPTLNPDGDFPIMDENDTFSERPNSFYVEDGSFLRAKTVMLGYTLPSSAFTGTTINKVRFYIQAQNLFTVTNYSGIDPALSNFGTRGNGDQWAGNDFGNYPGSRVFMVGVNLGF